MSGTKGAADPTFFARPAAFRRWLERNHDQAVELLVGFYKVDSGRPSITWPESVDEALCFGWIDGVRRSIDEFSYSIRFSPRRARSVWSVKNVRRAEELIAEGRITPAGLAAFEKRQESRSRQYSYEQDEVRLKAEFERKLQGNEKAWAFFQSQPPYYRKQAMWWTVSAKREDTRLRRLEILIQDSAAGRAIPPFRAGGASS